jgi:hypothetical protein
VCFKAIMISKPQSYLSSKRSRHQRSDGDCALSLGTPVASTNGHVGHTVRPYGSGSRRTATGEPDRLRIDSDMRLSRVRQRPDRRPILIATKATLFMGPGHEVPFFPQESDRVRKSPTEKRLGECILAS